MKIIRIYGPVYLFSVLMSSCAALKPQAPAVSNSEKKNSPFLQNISVTTGNAAPRSGPVEEKMPALVDNYSAAPMAFNTGFSISDAANAQFRYSILLNTEVENLSNRLLYLHIDEWMGTPYKIGGSTRRGIDCSGFAQNLMAAVFQIPMARTASEQKQQCELVSRDKLSEGDLVFFNTRGGVSHVGVYLHNNKFVHASTSAGVIISDLSEPYWDKRFLTGGRPLK